MPPADPSSDPFPISEQVSDHDRAYLTVAQAAGILHLSESSVRSYIRQGALKAFRVAGLRKVLIPREELLKLLAPV